MKIAYQYLAMNNYLAIAVSCNERCLLNNLDCQIENVSTVIIACCLLRDICQLNKEDYTDSNGILEGVIRQE